MKIPIHVSMSNRLLAELDEYRGKKPRSTIIGQAVRAWMNEGEGGATVSDADTKQLMVALTNRNDIEPILRVVLMHLLTQR